MCLTGVDYFSTLGYQPSIAFLAAGYLSPFATLVLVLLTLVGRAAGLQPHRRAQPARTRQPVGARGAASPLARQDVRPRACSGFAATDFVITITLSAADATEHIVENPFVPGWIHHQMIVTLVLIAALGAVFLKGFREAIWLAVALVAAYVTLNAVIVLARLVELVRHPEHLAEWQQNLFAQDRTR